MAPTSTVGSRPAAIEQVAQQRGRGRLAVRAGDGHPEVTPRRHQLAEERLPGDDLDPPLPGGDQLREIRLEAERRR